MLVKTINLDSLNNAIEVANDKIGHGNIEADYELKHTTRDGLSWYRVRLKVKDCHKPGARLAIRYDLDGTCHVRHTSSACWHACGAFFDALPPDSIIRARGKTIKPGDTWWDYNIGSQLFPVYFSESCDCGR